MLRRFVLVLTFILFMPGLEKAYSGHERGNGGDVLLCRNQNGSTVQFFDLYEAQTKYGLTLIAPEGNSLAEKVESLIKRVEKSDSIRAQLYRKWFSEFFNESIFRPGIILADVSDSGDAFWPRGCEIVQLVVQTDVNPPVYPYRYTFSADVWNQLDLNSQAATILHEMLLRETRMTNQQTSVTARYVNGLIWSDTYHMDSIEEYIVRNATFGLAIFTTLEGLPGWHTKEQKSVSDDQYRALFADFIFDFGPARFKMKSRHAICQIFTGSIYQESWKGECTKDVYDFEVINNSIFPEDIVAAQTVKASFKYQTSIFKFYGSLILKRPYQLNLKEITTHDFKKWEAEIYAQNSELYVEFENNTFKDFKIKIHDIFLKKEDMVELQLKIDSDLIYLGIDWLVSTKDQEYESYAGKFTCKSGEKIIYQKQADIRSCVLKNISIFTRSRDFKKVSVPAGKKIFLDEKSLLEKFE